MTSALTPILNFLSSISPGLAIIIVVGLIVAFLSYYFINLNRDLKEIKEGFKSTNEHLAKLDSMFENLSEDLERTILFITSKYPSAFSAFGAKHSPMQLNEKGIELFNTCGGAEFINKHKELLFESIDKTEPKTALDVEIKAKDVLTLLTENDIFNDIKVWIYNAPSWTINGQPYTITLADICFVISIPLRDLYLEAHPDIAK